MKILREYFTALLIWLYGNHLRYSILSQIFFTWHLLQSSLDARMARDLLENGRTHVKSLYSMKKDKYFAADLQMRWEDGMAKYSLDFQGNN